MNRWKPVRIILASIALCMSIPLAAGAQVVQLTHDPEEIYLPPEIQIQDAVRLEDGRVLVVWGTTAEDSAGVDRTVLVYQFADSTTSIGVPRPLTSVDARPERSLKVICAPSGCFVFWNDARADVPGTYMQSVRYDGELLPAEVLIDLGAFASIRELSNTISGDVRIVLNSDSGARQLTFDGQGNLLSPEVVLDQPITQVIDVNGLPYSQVMILSSGTGIPVFEDRLIDPNVQIPSERIFVPLQVGEDGMIWVQEDSVLAGYSEWWSERPDTVIGLPGTIYDGVLFGSVRPDGIVLRRLTSSYDTIYMDGSDVYRNFNLEIVSEVYSPPSVPRQIDTLPIGVLEASRVFSGGYPYQNNISKWYFGFESLPRFPIRITIHVEGESRGKHNRIPFHLKYLSQLNPNSDEIFVVSDNESNSYNIIVSRIADPEYSQVQVDFSDSSILLGATAGRYRPNTPVSFLALISRGSVPAAIISHARTSVYGDVYCPASFYRIDRETLAISDSSNECLPLSVTVYDPGWEADDLEWSNILNAHHLRSAGNFVFASTQSWRRDWFKMNTIGTSYPVWYTMAHRLSISADSSFRRMGSPLEAAPRSWNMEDPGDYWAPWGAWDPNSGGLFVIIDVLRGNWGPRSQMYARISPEGNIDTAREVPFTRLLTGLVPISISRFLYCRNLEVKAFPEDTLVTRFTTELSATQFQRLHGDRFVRSGYDSTGHRVEVYSLTGESIASVSVPDSNSQVVVDPDTPRVVLISVRGDSLHFKAFNQNLESSEDRMQAVYPGPEISVSNPVGAIIGNTMYVAWVGTERGSGRQEAYLSRVWVPGVPARVDTSASNDSTADVDTIQDQNEETPDPPDVRGRPLPIPHLSRYGGRVPLSLYPNPTTGELHVPIRLGVGWAVTIAVVDELGRVVHREEFQGRVGENHFLVDLSRLQSGAYVVRLTAGEGEGIGRVWVSAMP